MIEHLTPFVASFQNFHLKIREANIYSGREVCVLQRLVFKQSSGDLFEVICHGDIRQILTHLGLSWNLLYSGNVKENRQVLFVAEL